MSCLNSELPGLKCFFSNQTHLSLTINVYSFIIKIIYILETIYIPDTISYCPNDLILFDRRKNLQSARVGCLLTCTHKQVPCTAHPCSNRSWKRDSYDGSVLRSGPEQVIKTVQIPAVLQ